MQLMQLITFLRARQERKPVEFQEWYLNRFASRMQQDCPFVLRHVVNLTEAGPEELRTMHDSDDPQARYDVVTQLWCETASEIREASARQLNTDLLDWADVHHSYSVQERVVLDKSNAQSNRQNGFKLLRELIFFEDLSDAAAKRCWAHHGNLAVKIHVGMTRYSQLWVEETLSPAPLPARGISELFFPTHEDLAQRYYESPRGREQVLHDTGHFIQKRLPRVYSHEHVVKA
jgi:hypothetical protein